LQAAQVSLTPVVHFILPIEATNSTSARTEGAELEMTWRAAENLNLSLGYSFLNMDLRGPPPSAAIASEAAEDQSPRNQANLSVQWEPARRLQLDLNVYYVGKLPAFSINSHVRTDLRLGYGLSDHVELELVGQDVFDESYREFGSPTDANAASIERSVFGRLTWRS
jgi:iron complex outermembrane recepter protein